MRSFIQFLLAPSPRGNGAYDRLTAGMDVDMLHRDLLLPEWEAPQSSGA